MTAKTADFAAAREAVAVVAESETREPASLRCYQAGSRFIGVGHDRRRHRLFEIARRRQLRTIPELLADSNEFLLPSQERLHDSRVKVLAAPLQDDGAGGFVRESRL